MAGREKRYTKTVSFFRLVALPGGNPAQQRDWSKLLEDASEETLAKAAKNSEVDGDVVAYDKKNRLVLSRDRGNAPRQRNLQNREKRAMRTQGSSWNPIEESFITFLDAGNVFAFARSSAIGPPARLVAEWINASGITSGIAWGVEPLIDPERYERLRQENGVTMVDVVARPALAPENASNSLIQAIASLRSLGDVKIEIRATVSHGRKNRPQQQALRDQALEVLGAISEDDSFIEGARVKKIGESDPIDLIEHHMTSKGEITIELGAQDRSMTDDIVFRASDGIIADNLQSVLRIIGA
ncbi:hypothetical protein WCD74_28825 [Actinomycetospora sp. OC33-EN08]|uniref:Uncharacterized protein n=1 Tax=Actinomycetospora aurantiaca TaxID=3129233 RepID=A0ABU8MZF7_9PSEU